MRIPEPPSYTIFNLLTLAFLLAVHFTLPITLTNLRIFYATFTPFTLHNIWRTAYQHHLLHQTRNLTLQTALLALYTLELETKTARLDAKTLEVDLKTTAMIFALLELGAKMVVVGVQAAGLREPATTDWLDRLEELKERTRELEGESERVRGLMVELRVAVAEMRVMARELGATVEAGRMRRELWALWWRG